MNLYFFLGSGRGSFSTSNKSKPSINLRPVPEIVKPKAGTTKRPLTAVRNPVVTRLQEFARPSNYIAAGTSGDSGPQKQPQAGYNSAYKLPKNIGGILLKAMRDNKNSNNAASINTPRPQLYQTEGGEFMPPATFMYGFKPITNQPQQVQYSTAQPPRAVAAQPQYQQQQQNVGYNNNNNIQNNVPQKSTTKYKSYRGGNNNTRPKRNKKAPPSVIDKISNFLEPFTLPFKSLFTR